MKFPAKNEYNPYFQNYLNLLEKTDLKEIYVKNTREVIELFSKIDVSKESFSYAEGKWSIKQVLMHINDTERVLSYRALVCLRCDSDTQIQSFDDDHYASYNNANNRSLNSILEEFKSIRKSTELLFENIPEGQSSFIKKQGEFNITARALAYIIPGHAKHHLNILNERYLY